MDKEAFIHFVGGAAGGTAGTAITCPLEVVKTRLQSSLHRGTMSGKASTSSHTRTFDSGCPKKAHSQFASRRLPSAWSYPGTAFPRFHELSNGCPSSSFLQLKNVHSSSRMFDFYRKRNIVRLFRGIVTDEGFSALFKGLGPNLVGVAPSKAVYFYTYSSCKRKFNTVEIFVPNSAMVHMTSAAFAGFVAATAVNPIWLVKTRLQLHHGPLTIPNCIRRVYRNEGIKGFYKGVTASYMGISETVIQFVLYEYFRSVTLRFSLGADDTTLTKTDFATFMAAGGFAKLIACIAAYPHEVVRTRLREEHSRYKGFFSTLFSVYRLEGFLALYRGLTVQLLRTVPNTAITMGTYELVVYLLHKL